MLLLLFFLASLSAAGQWYAGGSAGIATLSGDGAANVTATAAATAQYQPRIGLAAQAFTGRTFGNYFATQGAFSWNRNQLTFIGLDNSAAAFAFEQQRRSQQFTLGIDGLIYFRKRGERLRPYVSGGVGWLRVSSSAATLRNASGAPPLPAARFIAHKPYWRTAVGLDVTLKHRWRFRYTFWETVSTNPFGAELRPQGRALLLNFHNQFGLLREF